MGLLALVLVGVLDADFLKFSKRRLAGLVEVMGKTADGEKGV